MKLAFSTLGCPDWNIETIITKATEYGYEAVEIRGLQGTFDIHTLPEFSSQAKNTAQKFKDANLKIPSFSTSICLFTPFFGPKKPLTKNLEEIERYAELCHIFDSQYIRVFGGRIGTQKRSEAVAEAVSILNKMGQIASRYNAMILLETHDDWAESVHIKTVMEELDSEEVGVLWDIHHPVVFAKEDPVETWNNVGKWVKHTHLKDSFFDGENHLMCLVGEGDLPVKQFCDVLQSGGYSGYYSFEWPKKRYPKLQNPEVAFPRFVQYMEE